MIGPGTKANIIQRCREIVALRDKAADLYARSETLKNDSAEASQQERDTLTGLAALLGEKFDERAFETCHPSDGRKIVITVRKNKDVSPSVRIVPLLNSSGDDEEEGT